MISKEELIELSKKTGLKPFMQEKHYLQSLVLSRIYSVVTAELVFKGGTALFFFNGLNRFSEDLDFSLNGDIELDPIKDSISSGFELLNIPVEITDVDSQAGVSFKVKAQGPLYSGELSIGVVDVEISDRRDVLLNPVAKNLVPIYDDLRPFTVSVMDLKEIMAEKVRAVLKRDKARDIYDIWFLLKKGVAADERLFEKKMDYYGESFRKSDFDKAVLLKKKLWKSELSGLIGAFPSFEEVQKLILESL